jgi:DNA-binding NarL/FixJ family response regulator
MLTTATVSLLFILICVLFFYSKQGMLKRLFSNQLSYPASELQDQLELTADLVIKNLESHITHLEDLIGEADERIKLLDHKIHQAPSELPEQLNSDDLAVVDVTAQQDHQTVSHVITPYGVTQYRQQAISGLTKLDMKAVPASLQSPSVIKVSSGKGEANESVNQPVSQQRQVIIAMFKQGYTATEIAKVTGLGKGEILLFFQLHNNDSNSVKHLN